MKLKGKLIMSAAALAACAATLTSTTYAWYTTNTEVTASGLTAGSASSGDSSILISKTGENNTWMQNITDLTAKTQATLVPLMLDSTDGKLYPVSNTVNTEGQITLSTTAATKSSFVEFDLWFKTSATDNNVPIYLKSMTIANTASSIDDLPAFENLNNGKDEAGINKTATSYKKDIVDALAFTIQTNSDSETTYGKNSPFTLLDGKSAYKPIGGWMTSLGTEGEATNAHTYYNKLDSNKQLAESISTDNSAVIDSDKMICVLKNDGTKAHVTFRFYLNGSDVDCFDACKGQNFKLSLSFTSSSASV